MISTDSNSKINMNTLEINALKIQQDKEQLEKTYKEAFEQLMDQQKVYLDEIKEINFPKFNPKEDYQSLFENIYSQNEGLMKQIHQKICDVNHIHISIMKIEEKIFDSEMKIQQIQKDNLQPYLKKQKNRRKNKDIDRKFTCPYQDCERKYGGDVALNNHIKIKHGGGTKTERIKMAKQIIEKKSVDCKFNLYPGFIESIKKQQPRKSKDTKSDIDSDIEWYEDNTSLFFDN